MNFDAKTLFLIDGIGAVISAFSLGFVLVYFQAYIGMPKKILYVLSFFPCLFVIYDWRCYFRIKKNISSHLYTIALFNLLYSVLSISLLIYYYDDLTQLGLTYFILELIILFVLITLEFRAAWNGSKTAD